ncbi:response regulator transcription factor [Gordonia sp. NPDC003376]
MSATTREAITPPPGLTLIVGASTRESRRTVDAILTRAGRSGALVLRHRFTADRAHPLGALQSLLRHITLPVDDDHLASRLLRRLQRLVASAEPDVAEPDVLAMIGGLVGLARAAEPMGPAIILLNDLDLIDRASADVLVGVARRLRDQPIAILATASPDAAVDDRIVTRRWHLTDTGPEAGTPEMPTDPTEATRRALAELRSGDIDRAASELAGAVESGTDPETRGRLLAAAAGVAADVTANLDQVSLLLRQALSADRTAAMSLEAQVAHLHLGLGSGMRLTTLAHSIAAGLRDHDRIAGRWVLDEALWVMFLVASSDESDDIWDLFSDTVSRLGDRVSTWATIAAAAVGSGAGGRAPAEDSRILASTDDPAQTIRVAFATNTRERHYWWRDGLERLWTRRYPTASAIYAAVLLTADGIDNGNWDRAASIAAHGLALRADRDHHPVSEAWLHHGLGVLDAHRGNDSTASEHADFLAAWSTPRGARRLRDRSVHIRAAGALAADQPRRAHRLLAGLSGNADYGELIAFDDRTALEFAEAAQRSDARDHLAALHRRLTEMLDAPGRTVIGPDSDPGYRRARSTMLFLGALAITTSDVEVFTHTLARPDRDRWPFTTARVRLAFARVLRRDSGPAAVACAGDQLRRAAMTFQLLGARPWLEQTRRELHSLGVLTGIASSTGFERLGATQQRIAEMAAAGRTNREIATQLVMSPSTVGTHLHHVYGVLGVRSRAALRDLLHPRNSEGDLSRPAQDRIAAPEHHGEPAAT